MNAPVDLAAASPALVAGIAVCLQGIYGKKLAVF